MNHHEHFRDLILEISRDILTFSETPKEGNPKILEKLHEISGAKAVALFRCSAGSVHPKHESHELIDMVPKPKKNQLGQGLFERLTALLHSQKEIVVISDEFHKELYDELIKSELGHSILLPMKIGNTTIGGVLMLGLPHKHKLEFIIPYLEILGNLFALVFRFSELYMNMEDQVAEGTADFKASEEKFRKFFEEDLTGDFLMSAEGILLDCNRAFLEIYCLAQRQSTQAICQRVLLSPLWISPSASRRNRHCAVSSGCSLPAIQRQTTKSSRHMVT